MEAQRPALPPVRPCVGFFEAGWAGYPFPAQERGVRPVWRNSPHPNPQPSAAVVSFRARTEARNTQSGTRCYPRSKTVRDKARGPQAPPTRTTPPRNAGRDKGLRDFLSSENGCPRARPVHKHSGLSLAGRPTAQGFSGVQTVMHGRNGGVA